MFKVIVKRGDKMVSQETFNDPYMAESRFAELSSERTDGPGAIVLASGNRVLKRFLTKRVLPNESRLTVYEGESKIESLTYRSVSLDPETNRKLEELTKIRYRGIGGKLNQVIRDLINEEWSRLKTGV